MAFRANEPAAAMLTAEALEAAGRGGGREEGGTFFAQGVLAGYMCWCLYFSGCNLHVGDQGGRLAFVCRFPGAGRLGVLLGLFLVFVAGAELFTATT